MPRKRSRIHRQTGHSNLVIDSYLRAKRHGYRKSRTGRVYFEARKNRSDVNPRRRL